MHPSTTLAGSESPVALPAFLDGFRAIHTAMRRDSTRLARIAPFVGDRHQARRLARWYAHFLVSIEHHHQREDHIVWPLLVDREPGFAAEIATLHHDHEVLDEALHAVSDALRDLVDGIATDPAALVDAATRLSHHLEEHLDREEAVAFPTIARRFTAEEYHGLEDELRKGLSLPALAFEAPWVMDGLSADEVASMFDGVPLALRVLYRLAFRPQYRRLSAILEELSR